MDKLKRMRWETCGKIFDTGLQSVGPAFEFAQSPQVLLFDNFIRIYFSTRQKDMSGKFLSHIAFVDMDLTLNKVVSHSSDPVIALGELGAFDEHGIFPFSPMRNGEQVWAYTCGWSRRTSVSVETSTGLAMSNDDGKTFKKLGNGPIFSSSLHEPFLVGDSFVRIYDGVFYMWYIYGLRWMENDLEGPARVYKIAQATSSNGINWERNGLCIIPDVLGEDECQALPSVLFHQGLYHMAFCFRYATGFRSIKGRGYRLGYAYSSDLKNWTRNDDFINIAPGEWDNEMMCYPHLFLYNDKIHLIYNGNSFGKYGFGLAILEDE